MWYMQWNYHTNFLDLHERQLWVSACRQCFQKWSMRDNEGGGMFICYIWIVFAKLSCILFEINFKLCFTRSFPDKVFGNPFLISNTFIGFHCASLRRAGKFANFPPNSRIWQCAWGDIYMFMQQVIAFIQLISNENSSSLVSTYYCNFQHRML